MRTRLLTTDDWALWRDIRLRALQDSPSAFGSTYEREQRFTEQTWRERLDDPEVASVMVEQDGRPTAMGAGVPEPPADLHVVAMWVDPGRRGHGLAGEVLRALAAHAGERGLRLRLDVNTTNTAAIRCYERFGFVPTGATTPMREGSAELKMRMVR